MRPSKPLIISALSCRAAARFLAWTLDLRGVDLTRPTQTQPPNSQDIDIELSPSEPIVTPPPSQAVAELLLKRASSSSSNTWENDNTCGWYSGLSSKAYVCDSPLTCATDTDHVVACSTAGVDEFYTICLDYEAVQSSKCTSAGPKTGCCEQSSQPACGTFIWTGSPSRVMYKCFATPTIISMLDEPQFVIDASSSSAAAASSSSAAAAASKSSAAASSSAAAASRASGIGGSSVTITTTATDGSSTTFTAVAGATGTATGVTLITSVLYTTTGSDGSSTTYTAIAENGVDGSNGSNGSSGGSGGSNGGSNTGAIAGGVIGGILALLLLLLLLWYLMRKRNKFAFTLCGGKKKTKKEKHVHNKEYNEKNVDKRAYNTQSPSESSSGGRGLSLSLGGAGKKKTKKEKNITNNYYYGDEVKNDNRSYDKRAWKDNRKYDNTWDSHSRSVTPSQQTQNFHFEVEGQGPGNTAERGSASRGFESPDETLVGVAALGGRGGSSRRERRGPERPSRAQTYEPESRSPSPSPVRETVAEGTSRRDKRRQQRRRARGEYSPEPEVTPEPVSPRTESEMSYGREPQQPQHVHLHVHVHDRDREPSTDRGEHDRGRESARSRHHDHDQTSVDELEDEEWQQEQERYAGATHRYHPNSGRRNMPASRSPSPPPAGLTPHPDDFIGRGL